LAYSTGNVKVSMTIPRNGPAELDVTTLGQVLDGVLREPPFVEIGAPSLGERILRWAEQAFSPLPWSPASGQVARSFVFSVLSLLLLGSVLVLLARRRGRRRRPVLAPTGRLGSGPEPIPAPSGLALARSAWARGDARDAVEGLWQSVAALGPRQSSLTPRQNVRRLRAQVSPALYQELERVLWAHERACYAGHPPGLSEVAALIDALTPLLERSGLPSGPGVSPTSPVEPPAR
jgi:uncharacterized protein DUF4129